MNEYAVSQPVADEWQAVISYWTRRLVVEQRWDEIRKRYIEPPKCEPWSGGTQGYSAEDDSTALTPLHCLGAFVFFGVAVTLALILNHLQQRKWARRSAMKVASAVEQGAHVLNTAKSSGVRGAANAAAVVARWSTMAPPGRNSDEFTSEDRGSVGGSCAQQDGGGRSSHAWSKLLTKPRSHTVRVDPVTTGAILSHRAPSSEGASTANASGSISGGRLKHPASAPAPVTEDNPKVKFRVNEMTSEAL